MAVGPLWLCCCALITVWDGVAVVGLWDDGSSHKATCFVLLPLLSISILIWTPVSSTVDLAIYMYTI